MRFLSFFSLLFILFSCSDSPKVGPGALPPPMPSAPASVEAVKGHFKDARYTTVNVGFIRTFMGREDSAIWSASENDTSKHFRDFVDDRLKFSLSFTGDSTVKLFDDKKEIEAMYELEKDTSGAVLLLVKYEDNQFAFGSDEPMMMTYTYKIRGIDQMDMYLETPRSYNDRAVVMLMKKSPKK